MLRMAVPGWCARISGETLTELVVVLKELESLQTASVKLR